MTESLVIADLSPFKPRDDAEERWLGRVQEHVRAGEFVIRLGDAAEQEDDFIVSRDSRGTWWGGRYIGELAFEGRRLEIRPRFGVEVIARWLEAALNIVAISDMGERDSSAFVALLMAAVWVRDVDRSSRHGPPAFRRDHPHVGLFVRGRLDVRESVRLRAHGSAHVASVTRNRDLDNDVSRALVAAERVLHQAIGHRRWHTPRTAEVMPQLTAAVGTRPAPPSQRALQRIRYTPITRPFKETAALSWHIARREGLGAHSDAGDAYGLLIDVAELWELFLYRCVEAAVPELSVEHGTTSVERTFLLARDADESIGMGKLKPDIIARDGDAVCAIIDAKYKRLANVWPERRDGVDRSDLYQLAAYLGRFDPDGRVAGMLLYPDDPEQTTLSRAEEDGPWRTQSHSRVTFARIPVTETEAVERLHELLEPGVGGRLGP